MTRHILARRTLLGGVTAASAAAILAACGGDPSTPAPAPVTSAPTVAASTTTGTASTIAPVTASSATSINMPGSTTTQAPMASSSAAPAMTMMTATGAGKPGGSLLMGTLGEANSINPFVATDAVGVTRIKMLFDQFVRLKPDTFEPKPGLAKSWKIDGNTFTFTLQDGLKFSDGSDLTADDVAFTLRGILAKTTASPNASKFFSIQGAREYNAGTAMDVAGIKVADAKTLVVMLATPDAALLANMRYVNPVPRKMLEGKDLSPASKEPFFSTKPVGAGPYVLQSWQVGGDFVMTRNPNYWQKGLPYLDKVTDRVIADAQSLVNSLLAGDIDASIYPSPAGADKLRANKDLTVVVPPFAAPEGWHFNHKHPYLGKKEVRQAIAMALDIKQFAKDSLYGLGQEAVGPIAPGNYAFDKTLKPIPYDLEKAKALIKQAGAPPSEPIEFITNKGNVLREDFLTLTQAQLAMLGIKVNAQAIEFATLIDRRRKRDFQAVCINGGATVSPNDLYDSFATAGSQNFGNYTNPKVDDLLAQANMLLDPEKQKPLYSQVQQIMLDDLPYFFAWYRPYLHVAKKKFAGYMDSADTGGLFYEIENWYVNG